MSFLLMIFLAKSAHAYESGNAPFCVMDNYGNTECYYYDLSSCQQAARQKFGAAACVKK
ncbi:MAG: hypothetical protein ACXVCP_08400 [Bdellovibrio sp.]